jgi:hypothetical protein
MKTTTWLLALICAAALSPAQGAVYAPTSKVGEFLRQFEKAYREGDQEWLQSAVDKDGMIDEAKAFFLGILMPKEAGETITDLKAVPTPDGYQLPNSLIDIKIAPTIPVDFLITFTRNIGGVETTIKIPAGYRDDKIWFAGVEKM